MLCFAFVVTGKVQGVFFRKYTYKKAVELGLTGWVRNYEDGSVRGEVCGSDEQLQSFERFLHVGSPKAKVTTVSWKQIAQKEFSSFKIVRE